MASSLNIQASLRSPMSSSDHSYSSGTSITSTRDTSPDLPHDLLNITAVPKAYSVHDTTSISEMGPALFHSSSEQTDRGRVNVEGDGRTTDLGRGLRPSTSTISASGPLSTNWRGRPAPSRNFGLTIDSTTGEGNMLPSPTTPPGFNRLPLFGSTESANMLNNTTETAASEIDLNRVYGYCYDRGDGQYTRLVPVDMLPPLKNIPPIQTDCSGLIVLPTPRMPGPNGQLNNTPRLQLAPATSPPGQQDLIQSRIDSIVASSPPPTNAAPKKTKIYCDKWIHDGTCAFTQQGCKYKHEMPTDKETQEKLGLFHGYPAWWKKLQADRQRPINEQSDAPITLPAVLGRSTRPQQPGAPQFSGSWRRPESAHHDGPTPTAPTPGTNMFYSKGTVRGAFPAGRGSGKLTSPFGPIAPPVRVDQDSKQDVIFTQSPPSSSPARITVPQPSNPYALLGVMEPLDNEPEDEELEQGVKLN